MDTILPTVFADPANEHDHWSLITDQFRSAELLVTISQRPTSIVWSD